MQPSPAAQAFAYTAQTAKRFGLIQQRTHQRLLHECQALLCVLCDRAAQADPISITDPQSLPYLQNKTLTLLAGLDALPTQIRTYQTYELYLDVIFAFARKFPNGRYHQGMVLRYARLLKQFAQQAPSHKYADIASLYEGYAQLLKSVGCYADAHAARSQAKAWLQCPAPNQPEENLASNEATHTTDQPAQAQSLTLQPPEPACERSLMLQRPLGWA